MALGRESGSGAWIEDLPIPKANEWPWVEILTSHAGARSETITHWFELKVEGVNSCWDTGIGGFHDAWKESLISSSQARYCLG
ncbi:hypothetical protein [Polynucleobacter necessarius]|uniref:hypothetical protein n=1 Tax=Polynucleobacter necessarius TaxID=576610 RepID=UPI001E3D6200|nr:hypothetical protein [Polynucleobacter necessarius]